MAVHVEDKDGRIIDTNILVDGYIRQGIEIFMNQVIPDELYQLCFVYWLHKVCDSWSSKFHQDNMIQINGDEITVLYNKYSLGSSKTNAETIYGNHVVENGSKFTWRLKMNEFGFSNSGMFELLRKSLNPSIGIIKDNDQFLKESCPTRSQLWTSDGYGYGLCGGNCALRPDNAIGFQLYRSECPKFNVNGDVIEVHLDSINYTLSYTVNDKYCGIAFDNIDPYNYRLAIALIFRADKTKFQFL